jgi:serine/threonine-protein kinase RIM15
MYEFMFGVPPFHAETPDQVFENILSRNILWPEDDSVSPEARDLMEQLLQTNVEERLGRNGAEEVKRHPWFKDVEWDTLLLEEPSFIPKVKDVADTSYFDDRGAEERRLSDQSDEGTSATKAHSEKPPRLRIPGSDEKHTEPADFGAFAYKNVSALERANQDVLRSLKSEVLSRMSSVDLMGGDSLPSVASPKRARKRTRTVGSIPSVR